MGDISPGYLHDEKLEQLDKLMTSTDDLENATLNTGTLI